MTNSNEKVEEGQLPFKEFLRKIKFGLNQSTEVLLNNFQHNPSGTKYYPRALKQVEQQINLFTD